MRSVRLLLVLPALVLGLLIPACGKKPPAKTPPDAPQPKAAEPVWKEFTSQKGKFTVLMPGTPQETTQDTATALGKIGTNLYLVDLLERQKSFVVGFADYPPELKAADAATAQAMLTGAADGIARSLKATAEKSDSIRLGEHHGKEVLLGGGAGQKTLVRLYLVQNRLYQLISSWSTIRGDTSADAEKFLNSFKLQ